MGMINWVVPATLTAAYSKTTIYRSSSEQTGYQPVDTIDTFDSNGVAITKYDDVAGNEGSFYVLRFFNGDVEFGDFTVGIASLTPREKRLVLYLISWIPEVMKPDITEFDIAFSLRLALNDFNLYPPEVGYTMDDFPYGYESLLIDGARVKIAQLKYLKLAIRDFTYNDMGLSLNIQRGEKIAKAIEDLTKQWMAIIDKAKWNFISAGAGLGTSPLPISMGGQISRGALNILDLMTSLGR